MEVAGADRHVDVAVGEGRGGVDGDDGLGGIYAGRVADVRAADVGCLQRQDAGQVEVGEVGAVAVLLDRLGEGQRDVRPRVGRGFVVGRVERRRRRSRGVHREGHVVRGALVTVLVVVGVGDPHVDDALGQVGGGVDRDDGLAGIDAGRVGDGRATGVGLAQRQD